MPMQENKPDERRREPRYPTLNRVVPVTADGLGGFDAEILDVSRSGLRLKAQKAIPSERRLVLRIDHLEIEGTVRYSRPNEDGSFDIGVKICCLWPA
ncbi:MAG: PilZ domain-containing protein [Bryobacteraceae bacterium]